MIKHLNQLELGPPLVHQSTHFGALEMDRGWAPVHQVKGARRLS